MARANYPTDADLEAFLLSCGFQPAFLAGLNLDYQRFADVGRDDFESKTGRVMLAVSSTRTFSPPLNPRGILDLTDDLVSASAVIYLTTALNVGTDYRLLPQNATQRNRPFSQMQFLLRWWWAVPITFPIQQAISITGLWGYGLAIPEDAWEGMLECAGLALWPLLATARFKGLLGWREADMAEQYGPISLPALRMGWMSNLYGDKDLPQVPGLVSQYRRVTVG